MAFIQGQGHYNNTLSLSWGMGVPEVDICELWFIHLLKYSSLTWTSTKYKGNTSYLCFYFLSKTSWWRMPCKWKSCVCLTPNLGCSPSSKTAQRAQCNGFPRPITQPMTCSQLAETVVLVFLIFCYFVLLLLISRLAGKPDHLPMWKHQMFDK